MSSTKYFSRAFMATLTTISLGLTTTPPVVAQPVEPGYETWKRFESHSEDGAHAEGATATKKSAEQHIQLQGPADWTTSFQDRINLLNQEKLRLQPERRNPFLAGLLNAILPGVGSAVGDSFLGHPVLDTLGVLALDAVVAYSLNESAARHNESEGQTLQRYVNNGYSYSPKYRDGNIEIAAGIAAVHGLFSLLTINQTSSWNLANVQAYQERVQKLDAAIEEVEREKQRERRAREEQVRSQRQAELDRIAQEARARQEALRLEQDRQRREREEDEKRREAERQAQRERDQSQNWHSFLNALLSRDKKKADMLAQALDYSHSMDVLLGSGDLTSGIGDKIGKFARLTVKFDSDAPGGVLVFPHSIDLGFRFLGESLTPPSSARIFLDGAPHGRFVSEEVFTVVGRVTGTYKYDTVFGGTNTVPAIRFEYLLPKR